MSDMRSTDPVVGFSFAVTYQGGPDGMPVITASPVRQRRDACDYTDRTEGITFTNGVAGIEAWLGKHIKSELAKIEQGESMLGWRDR